MIPAGDLNGNQPQKINWIALFSSYELTIVYGEKISKLFKNIPITITEPKPDYYQKRKIWVMVYWQF